MSSGGYRPGAGRKFGSKDKKLRGKVKTTEKLPLNQADKDKINELLAIDLETREKAKAYSDLLTRASKGESLTAAEKREMSGLREELRKRLSDGEGEDLTLDEPDAKEFLEKLLLSKDVDQKTKIQIANILLPFQHSRKGEGAGKKDEQADRAKAAGAGKFSASAPPKLAVVKK